MTKKLSFKILIVFGFLFIFFLSSGLLTKCQAVPCTFGSCGAKPGCCFGSVDCGSHWECRCQGNCPTAEIERQYRTLEKDRYCNQCVCTSNCGTTTETCAWQCDITGCQDKGASAQSPLSCESYELCQGPGGWTNDISDCSNNFDCKCAGHCLADPANTHIEDGAGPTSSTNVLLPAKLGWDDVSGANSYWYRVWKATSSNTGWETSDQGDFTAATTTGMTTSTSTVPGTGPCTFLQSTTTYSWKVRPCCSADGTNGTECKDWDDVSLNTFETSLAPELISPADPDWNNTTQMAIDVPIPVALDWCDVEEAEYYKIKVYSLDSGIESLLEEIRITESSGPPTEELNSDWTDFSGWTFLADSLYRWEVSTCFLILETGLDFCSGCSQKWGFTTTSTLPDESFDLLAPPDDPSPDSAVGIPTMLSWTKKIGFNSFNYQFRPINPVGPLIWGTTSASGVILDLNLNTVYEWTARPCTDHQAQNCKPLVFPKWQFRTTGASPSLKSPINNATDVTIPVNFDWDDVSGAGSYRIQVEDIASGAVVKEAVVSGSGASVDYPDLKMEVDSPAGYRWRVQTCADGAGTPSLCGDWTNFWTFTTFNISTPNPPANPISPTDGASIDTPSAISFSWTAIPGAKAYQYIIYKSGGEEVINKIVHSNSVIHYPLEFPDIDTYGWKVKACLDTACTAFGDWSTVPNGGNLWHFDLNLIAPLEQRGGLIPCGKNYDDPDTPWNEREQCQISHIFLLFRNVLDFLLWKIATILLVLILLAAGALFYISMGDASIIFKVKSLLKTMVIGYLIIFFSWFIINLLLALLGYKFQFFGHWWEIPL